MPSFAKVTQVKYRLKDVLGFKDSLQLAAPLFTTCVASLLSVTSIKYTQWCSSQQPNASNQRVDQDLLKKKKEKKKTSTKKK